MRNPPDSKKRPRDEGVESRVSLTRLRELEEQLGYAMSQAGIVKMEREEKGSPNGRGVNKGSSGTMIYSLGSSYNRDLLMATLLKKSFSEVSASQTKKDSFVRFQRQLNADDLRSIYDEIKDIPRANLDSHNLNLLCELKNVFLKIDKNKGLSEEGAPKPLTREEREAQFFNDFNKSQPAIETRPPKLEDRPQKRQKTSENWWGGLTNNFAPVINHLDQATNTILSAPLSFFGNFGISFTKPEEKKSVNASDLTERPGVAVFDAKRNKPDSPKPSSEKKEDRPSTFLNHLKDAPVLDSTVFSSSESLTARMKLWNSYMKKCNSPTENIQDYKNYRANSNTPEERRITKYSEYLQASIEKIKTLESEQSKILSGFLCLELAKVDHMVKGDNASADNSEHTTREVVTEPFIQKEGLGWQESIKFWYRGNIGPHFPSENYEHTDPAPEPIYYSPSQRSNDPELRKIKEELYSKIPETSQDAIYHAQNAVSKDVNFVDTINFPRTVKTSNNFKSNFSQEIATFWKKINPLTYKPSPSAKAPAQAQAQGQAPSPSPSPSLEKPSLTDEAQSVKDKINDNHTGVEKLQGIVDSPINFSKSIFDVTSEIDIAIGVMKPQSSKFDLERFKQENDLKNFLKDSKSLLNSGDAVRGRSSDDPRRENIYAYVEFLDDRIQILQDVVNDLKSKPSQDMSIKKLKKMQANLGLELVRISDSLTPQSHIFSPQDGSYSQRVNTQSGTPNPIGPVHHEASLRTLRVEKKKKNLGTTFSSMLDKDRFEASKSFAYSDKKVAPANQDFLKSRVDEALTNLKGIRRENRGGEKGGGR